MGKWIQLVAFVGGMVLAMLFMSKIGYWIEGKVQIWLAKRRQDNKDKLS